MSTGVLFPLVISSVVRSEFPDGCGGEVHGEREGIEPGGNVGDPCGERTEIAFQDQTAAQRDFDRFVFRRVGNPVCPIPAEDTFEPGRTVIKLVCVVFAPKFPLTE